MITRRLAVAVLAAALLPHVSAAQPQSAQAFLDALYDAYRGKDSKGVALDNDDVIRSLFAPALATRIIDDAAAAAKRNEVPTLDGDPFVDAQDFELSDVTVSVQESGDKADGRVSFKNFGEAKTLRYDLVRTASGWRIADIHDDGGHSLSRLDFQK